MPRQFEITGPGRIPVIVAAENEATAIETYNAEREPLPASMLQVHEIDTSGAMGSPAM